MRFLILIFLLLFVLTDAKRFKCNKSLSCGCGYDNVEISARVINGEEAVPYSWSMIVSLRYDFFHDGNALRHACGGTILTESYILTAASCLETIKANISSSNLTIAAGIHRRSQTIQIIREVDDVIIHPNWTGSWINDYDIALIHLSEPIDLDTNPLITRTCLSAQLDDADQLLNYPASSTTLAVVGWGRTSPYGDDTDTLRQIMVTSVEYNNTKCLDNIVDSIRQFCAGLYDISSGPCYDDFGGPIFQWIDDHWEQVGIGSFTSDGCQKSSIVGYTRLAYYHNWIEENLKKPETTTGFVLTITPIETTEKPSDIYECEKSEVPCGCGRRNVEIYRKNNTETIPYSWSMIVSIRLNNENKHSCSGTILSESYILTSASCIANTSSFGITILAGIHNSSGDDGIFRKVDRIYFHPDYTGTKNNNANDIAILHISESFNFTNEFFIKQICLSKKFDVLPDPIHYPISGTSLVIVGWGTMNCQNKSEQQLLQQVQVYAMNNLENNCYILNEHRNIQFCAGLNPENTVPCVRDPGSPIFEWTDDRWLQVGITSYLMDCVEARNVGIYTRLVEYYDWIQSIISTDAPIYSTTKSTTILDTTTVTPIPTNTTTISVKEPKFYPCNQTLTCGCGSIPVILTPSRIIGGEKAIDYSWPMMVSVHIIYENVHWCGGTIVSDSYILTAAHCLYEFVSNPPMRLTISAGMTDQLDPRQIRRTVDHIYIHPNYSGPEEDYRHDIALMHLNQSLPIKENRFLTKTCIHPVYPPIASEKYIKNGTRLTTIGWGTQKPGDLKKPANLQQVEVFAIDNEDPICIAAMNDSQTQFCAGLVEGGKDSCQGDSGGPIFQWTGDYWEQVGIVSHGNGCAEAGNPGIYTRLSYYYDWINEILKNDNEHLEPAILSNQTSIKPDFTTTIELVFNTTITSTIDANITTTIDANITTITDETTPARKNNGYIHQKNTSLFSILFLLFKLILT